MLKLKTTCRDCRWYHGRSVHSNALAARCSISKIFHHFDNYTMPKSWEKLAVESKHIRFTQVLMKCDYWWLTGNNQHNDISGKFTNLTNKLTCCSILISSKTIYILSANTISIKKLKHQLLFFISQKMQEKQKKKRHK